MLSSLHLLWISSSLIVSFSALIICVISLWLVTILPVSSSETLLSPLFVASGTAGGVAVFSHCFSPLLLLDLVSVMVLLTCVLVYHHLLNPIQFYLWSALLLIEWIHTRMLIFSVMPSRHQMSHLLLGHRRRTCIFLKLCFFLSWSRPSVFP